MSNALAKPWTLLHSEDGCDSIVVPEGTTFAEGLCELLRATHGVDVEPTHPLIVETAAGLKVQTWHSTTRAWREGEGVDGDWDTYWSADGDGKRTANVVYYPDDLYALGDEIESVLRLDGNPLEGHQQ